MIKRILGVFSAIAVSLTALALPAAAATTSLSIPLSAAGGINELNNATSKQLAVVLSVPYENKVLATNTIGFTLSGLESNSTVSVVATNAKLVTALHTTANPVTAASGAETLSIPTGGATTVSFYGYTTSSDYGTISVSYQGNTTTYHLKGLVGPAYNIQLIAPEYLQPGSTVQIQAIVSDVFGNLFDSTSAFNPVTEISTAAVGGATWSQFAWNVKNKVFEASLTDRRLSSRLTLSAEVVAVEIDGLPAPKNLSVATIEVRDLSIELKAMQAQLDQAIADLNNFKSKYNKLVKRWNKKFPEKKIKQDK